MREFFIRKRLLLYHDCSEYYFDVLNSTIQKNHFYSIALNDFE